MSSVDPSRPHEVGQALAWHGRLMVLGWGVLAPLAVLTARFYKILPGQNWPQTLDHRGWWHLHWITQSVVIVLALGALALILAAMRHPDAPLHRVIGYCVLILGATQYLSGFLRGSKGGPTDKTLRGDHFDMTRRRIAFEKLHKSLGYGVLALTMAATLSGLWATNAPLWMPLLLTAFWVALIVGFVVLQRRGQAVDTYQAIWGPDPQLPGNKIAPIGWGITRPEPKGD